MISLRNNLIIKKFAQALTSRVYRCVSGPSDVAAGDLGLYLSHVMDERTRSTA